MLKCQIRGVKKISNVTRLLFVSQIVRFNILFFFSLFFTQHCVWLYYRLNAPIVRITLRAYRNGILLYFISSGGRSRAEYHRMVYLLRFRMRRLCGCGYDYTLCYVCSEGLYVTITVSQEPSCGGRHVSP